MWGDGENETERGRGGWGAEGGKNKKIEADRSFGSRDGAALLYRVKVSLGGWTSVPGEVYTRYKLGFDLLVPGGVATWYLMEGISIWYCLHPVLKGCAPGSFLPTLY
jgi:hypothetical protein